MITPESMAGKTMSWVYLSPHLDDAALSCGGLIWEQVAAGQAVSVWTICAGDAPDGPLSEFAAALHARWDAGQAAAALRRQEDRLACQVLQAGYRHFTLPDCIYRQAPAEPRYLYDSEQAIFSLLDPLELPLVEQLASQLASSLPAQATLVVPLALGGHVDHRLVRQAAERVKLQGLRILYYADYPYVLKLKTEFVRLSEAGWRRRNFPVTLAGLAAWTGSVAAHASQITTFWPGLAEMSAAIEAYWAENEGLRLWESP